MAPSPRVLMLSRADPTGSFTTSLGHHGGLDSSTHNCLPEKENLSTYPTFQSWHFKNNY